MQIYEFEANTLLCEQVFADYLKGKWQNYCFHQKNMEEEYWKQEDLMDEAIDSMIFYLG